MKGRDRNCVPPPDLPQNLLCGNRQQFLWICVWPKRIFKTEITSMWRAIWLAGGKATEISGCVGETVTLPCWSHRSMAVDWRRRAFGTSDGQYIVASGYVQDAFAHRLQTYDTDFISRLHGTTIKAIRKRKAMQISMQEQHWTRTADKVSVFSRKITAMPIFRH